MNSLFNLLAATDWSWVNTLTSTISDILWPLLIVVAAAGSIYAIVIGVNMAKADSTEKREEAKKRLFNLLMALGITIGLILFFQLFIEVILPALLPGFKEWQANNLNFFIK